MNNSLLSRFFSHSKDHVQGIVSLIGLSFAGKTTILHKLKSGKFLDHPFRTMGLNVEFFEYKNIKFTAFDLGGQEGLRSVWEPYLKESISVCYVIDSSDPEKYQESAEVLHSIVHFIPERSILLLLANKSDLAPSDALIKIVATFKFKELQETANLKAINLFYISAKTGDQFDMAFSWLADAITGKLRASKYLASRISK